MECCVCEPVYAFIDKSVCLYRVNEQSVTYQYKKDMIAVWTAIAENFDAFCTRRGVAKDYRDLSAFHTFFGSFYLVKQEWRRYGLKKAVKELRRYGRQPIVKKYMKQLAKGDYVREIHAGCWKPLIRCAAAVFCMHGYLLYTAGAVCLLQLRVDQWISRLRYQSRQSGRGS